MTSKPNAAFAASGLAGAGAAGVSADAADPYSRSSRRRSPTRTERARERREYRRDSYRPPAPAATTMASEATERDYYDTAYPMPAPAQGDVGVYGEDPVYMSVNTNVPDQELRRQIMITFTGESDGEGDGTTARSGTVIEEIIDDVEK